MGALPSAVETLPAACSIFFSVKSDVKVIHGVCLMAKVRKRMEEIEKRLLAEKPVRRHATLWVCHKTSTGGSFAENMCDVLEAPML